MSRKPRATVDIVADILREQGGIRYPNGSIGPCTAVIDARDAWGNPIRRICDRGATWRMPDGRVYCSQHAEAVARASNPDRDHLRVVK